MNQLLVDAKDTWAIGWYPSPNGPVPYAPRREAMDGAREVATERIKSLGVGTDDMIVFACRSSEAIQFAPYERAANLLGASFGCLDGLRADGQRLLALTQLLRPRAVLGIPRQLVLGLGDIGVDPVQLLAGVDVIAARPQAKQLLGEQGIEALLWLHAGPAVAVECLARDGAHIDPAWQPSIVKGELAIETDSGGVTERLVTAIRAELTDAVCSCGSNSPRVRLTSIPDFVD